MTLQPIDLPRIARAMNDPDAIVRQEPANDDTTFEDSPAGVTLLMLVGAVVVAMVMLAVML